MQKDKKSNIALKQKVTKGVQKVAENTPKQMKQQQGKLKKAVEAKTGVGKKQNSKKKPQKIIEVEESESEEEEIEQPESEDEQMEIEQEDAESDQENAESEEEDDEDDEDEEDEDSDQEEDDDQEQYVQQTTQNKNNIATNNIGVGNTIFLSHVPTHTKRVEIVKAFAPFGKVLAVIFNYKQYFFSNAVDKPAIRALVVLDSQGAVNKALAENNVVLNNRKIVLKKHEETECSKRQISNENNTVFVSDMNGSSTSISLRKLFSSCGEIAFINFLKGHEGKAFVCFKNPGSVSMALKLNGNIVDGNSVKVSKYAYTPKPNKIGKLLNKKVAGVTPKKGGKGELKGVQSKTIKKTPKKKVVPKQ